MITLSTDSAPLKLAQQAIFERRPNIHGVSLGEHTMTNAEILNLLVAGVALVFSGLAMFAAIRSARSAETAQQALIEDQLRFGRREVAQLVSNCAFENNRILFLAHTLKTIDRSMAVFVGGVGGSPQKKLDTKVQKQLDLAAEHFRPVSMFNENPSVISTLVQEDVDRLQVELFVHLGALRTISCEFERESASSEAQLLQHRGASL